MSLKGSNDDRLVMSKRLSRRTRQRTSDYRRALSYARKQKTMRQFDASRFVGLRQLGKGGFGLVSLARDIETGEHVVIKGLPKCPKSGRAWFDNIGTELVMAQKLKPLCGQIVPCMRGIFDTEHAYFMVSEYLGADMIPLDRLICHDKYRIERNHVRPEILADHEICMLGVEYFSHTRHDLAAQWVQFLRHDQLVFPISGTPHKRLGDSFGNPLMTEHVHPSRMYRPGDAKPNPPFPS